MNWDQVKGNWRIFKGDLKVRWGKLIDDDLDVIEGNREQFIGLIQKRYGISRETQLGKYLQSRREGQEAPAAGKH